MTSDDGIFRNERDRANLYPHFVGDRLKELQKLEKGRATGEAHENRWPVLITSVRENNGYTPLVVFTVGKAL